MIGRIAGRASVMSAHPEQRVDRVTQQPQRTIRDLIAEPGTDVPDESRTLPPELEERGWEAVLENAGADDAQVDRTKDE